MNRHKIISLSRTHWDFGRVNFECIKCLMYWEGNDDGFDGSLMNAPTNHKENNCIMSDEEFKLKKILA